MQQTFSDVIVGNGIAAHAFLWTYAQSLKHRGLDQARRICWLKSSIIPTCSLTSTSLVSCAGLHSGVSAFGDQLLSAYAIFEQNFSSVTGVIQATQSHLPHGDLENFKQRYADAPVSCLLVAGHIFLSQLEKEIMEMLGESIDVKNATVLSHEKKKLRLHAGEELSFERCLFALGAGNAFYNNQVKGRYVAGQYAWTECDLGERSFVLSRGPHNLIYRSLDRRVLVGSLDDKDDSLGWPLLAPRAGALKAILNSFEYSLPANLQWTIESGVRHKGVKRQPFWGALEKDVYSVHGLYKNGYTLAFLAAKELVASFF